MKTEEDALRRFLLTNGCTPESAERAIAALAPFARAAESGRYPLGRASTADVSGIAVALWHAGPFHAKGCVFLPSCAAYRRSDDGRETEDATLLARLRARYDHERTPALAGPAFAKAVDGIIGPALAALGRELERSGDVADMRAVETARYAVTAFAAFAAEGRREAAALAPLVALLPTFVPLFEDRRRDGIWYVLSGC